MRGVRSTAPAASRTRTGSGSNRRGATEGCRCRCWQQLGGGAWGEYPAEGLAALGSINGLRVPCLTPELQPRHHLGYRPTDADRHDLRLLAEHYDLAVPPEPAPRRPPTDPLASDESRR